MDLTEKVARQVARVHWHAANTPLIAQPYLGALRQLTKLRDNVSFALWNQHKSPPDIDRRFARKILGSNQASATTARTPGTKAGGGRLIVRIAFHFNKIRLKYLIEMLAQLKKLPFDEVFVAIDTNSQNTEDFLKAAGCADFDEIKIHKLEDPFRLTWVHRDQLQAALDRFDYFMYAEDDLLITAESIELWRTGLSNLEGTGYLPAFLRVEQNRQGELVSSDFTAPAGRDRIHVIGGQSYLDAPFPYQAFWIYDKKTMLEFVESDVYRVGQPGFDLRESVSIGFAYTKTADGWKSRHLLPLDMHGNIDPRCFVYHMPSNYGRRLVPHSAGLGTIPITELIDRTSQTKPAA